MFRHAAVVAAGLIAVACARPAWACECESDGPAYNAQAARDRAQLIFEGVVDKQGQQSGFSGAGQVDLSAVKAHRSVVSSSKLSLSNGDDCAPQTLENGKRYLFYVGDAASMHINACSRVVAFPEAQAEVDALALPNVAPADPATPVARSAPGEPSDAPSSAAEEPPTVPPQAGGCGSCQTDSGRAPRPGIVVLLALAAASRWRRYFPKSHP